MHRYKNFEASTTYIFHLNLNQLGRLKPSYMIEVLHRIHVANVPKTMNIVHHNYQSDMAPLAYKRTNTAHNVRLV